MLMRLTETDTSITYLQYGMVARRVNANTTCGSNLPGARFG